MRAITIASFQLLAAALLDCWIESSKEGTPLKLRTFVCGRNRLENGMYCDFVFVFLHVSCWCLLQRTQKLLRIRLRCVISLLYLFAHVEASRRVQVLEWLQFFVRYSYGSRLIAEAWQPRGARVAPEWHSRRRHRSVIARPLRQSAFACPQP